MENKEQFVADLSAAFAVNHAGIAIQLCGDPIKYKTDGSLEILYSKHRAINVTGDSLTAIAEEYIRLLDGEQSRSEIHNYKAVVS